MSDLDAAYRALTDDAASPKVEALIEAMFLAATADGHFAPEESAKFAATIASIARGKIGADAIDRRVGQLSLLLQNEGRQARLASVAQRLPAGAPRETALMLAAAITASDGMLVARENDLLADLAEALEISPVVAVDLIERMQQHEKKASE
ncbi:MAG: hypothetical protein NVS3B10_11440 [Polyangiales bacterium]